jgi:DNA ligase (NAD+)
MDRRKMYENIVEQLNAASKSYYGGELETMSDAEWDSKFQLLKDYEEKFPEHTAPNSPTQTVGAPSGKNKIKHEIPLKSLAKSKNLEDIYTSLGRKNLLMLPKYDGNTCLLKFYDGKLVQAVSRGNGTEGEDITRHALCFNNIPLMVPVEGDYWVEGEAEISNENFASIKEKFSEYKNPRNLTSGLLHRSSVEMSHLISLYAFRVLKGRRTSRLSQELDFLRSVGFEVNYRIISLELISAEAAFTYKKQMEETMACDGVVFSVDSFTEAENMGETSHHPLHSMALKFQDAEATTVCTDITWGVGTFGTLTPVAVFEPVELEGTTVTNASVHNLGILNELDFGIGDTIVVYKANQIIPQILKAVTHTGYCNLPLVCPSCGHPITTKYNPAGSKVALLCENHTECPAQFLSLCEGFVGREYMNIDGLSKAGLEELISAGVVKKLVDILKLDELTIRRIPYFKGKRGTMLSEAITKSRSGVLPSTFLAAWHIAGVGIHVSKQLLTACDGDIQKFIEAMQTHKSFTHLSGFGELTQEKLDRWWKTNSEQFIEAVSLCNLNKTEVDVPKNGLKVVITGTLASGSRSAVSAKLQLAGYVVQDGINKETDILICGDKVGASKTDKAKKLGIKIMSESEFMSTLN